MLLWVLGMNLPEDWSINGVFSTREKAIAYCTTEDHYVFPVMLDDWLGDEPIAPPAEYPLLERKADE